MAVHYADTKEKCETVRELINLRKRQLKLFEDLSVPLRDNIKIAEDVLKRCEPLERLFYHNELVNRYVKKICQVV